VKQSKGPVTQNLGESPHVPSNTAWASQPGMLSLYKV
jgi:hypothetical protein